MVNSTLTHDDDISRDSNESNQMNNPLFNDSYQDLKNSRKRKRSYQRPRKNIVKRIYYGDKITPAAEKAFNDFRPLPGDRMWMGPEEYIIQDIRRIIPRNIIIKTLSSDDGKVYTPNNTKIIFSEDLKFKGLRVNCEKI